MDTGGEVDDLKAQLRLLKTKQDGSKKLFDKLDGQMGWQKYNIDKLNKLTEDLPMLYKQASATEYYLDKVLPIRTQAEIYRNVSMVIPEKDLYMRREFLEHNNYEFDTLIDKIKDPDPRHIFDKKSYHVPKYAEALEKVREMMRPKPKKGEAATISSKG